MSLLETIAFIIGKVNPVLMALTSCLWVFMWLKIMKDYSKLLHRIKAIELWVTLNERHISNPFKYIQPEDLS